MYFQDMHQKENAKHVFKLEKFYEHIAAARPSSVGAAAEGHETAEDALAAEAAAGYSFPEFTWLQPRMTTHEAPPTWQHPDASIREGERLIKEVGRS